MPDQTLELLIKIQSEVAELKATIAGMDELKDKTKGSVSVNEEATRAVGKHAEGHRELHKLLHAVAHQSPITGLALRAAFSPIGALIMTGVVALQFFHHWQEENKKQAEELFKALNEVWEASKKGAEEAAKVADDYAKKLKDVAESHDKLAEKYEREKTLLAATVKAHKELLDAMEKEEIANAQKSGDKEKEEEIKKRYEALKQTYDLTVKQMELQAKINELDELKKQHPEDAAVEARTRLKEKLELSGSMAGLESQNKLEDRAKLADAVKKADAQAAQWAEKWGVPIDQAPRTTEQTKAKTALDVFDARQNVVDNYNKDLEKLREEVSKTTEKETKHGEAVRKLTQEVETQTKVFHTEKSSAFAQANTGAGTTALSGADAAAHKFAQGGKLSAAEEALMITVASVAAGTSLGSAAAAKLLIAAEKDQNAQVKAMERLLTIAEKTEKDRTPLLKRLAILEDKVAASAGRNDNPH